MKARLARFLMGHVGWLYFGIPLLIGVAAGQRSVLLGIGLAAASLVGIERFLHNANPLTRWLREADDETIFEACRIGAMSGPRRMYRWLPADPRCRLCLGPFRGLGRLFGIRPSGKNPEFCNDCIETAPLGVHEREVGVLFADIRGFTADTEKRSSADTAASLSRFYALAGRVLTRDDALVEMVGDQVMALYLSDFSSLGERTCAVMVNAARRLVSEVDVPVGVGLHFGTAAVGNVAKGTVKDFTAVGDVVNTAARLQSAAKAGQIVVSEEVHARAATGSNNAEAVWLSLKGKAEPVRAHVIEAKP